VKKHKELTRRDFVKLAGAGGAGLVGVSLFSLHGFEKLFAAAISETPIVWIQGGACSGCSVSVLNSVSPTIQDIILGEVVPGHRVNLSFHPNISAGQGDQIMSVLRGYAKGEPGKFLLVVEGGIPTKDGGVYCKIGEEDGHGVTILQHVQELAPKALAIVGIGTCASFGGIPAADPNPTGIKSVSAVLKEAGIGTPLINIPGCPVHPDWFVGTVAMILMAGLGALDLDENYRPKAFYSKLIHDYCELRGQFEEGNFAKDYSDEGCLYELGCRGPETYADCPSRRWNNRANWCVGAGHPCMGCVEPEFPYKKSILGG